METLVTVIHVLAAASVIGLVLLQHGKGADMGAAFGSGASGSLFGVSGSSNFLSRATAVSVTIFFITSLSLAYLSSHRAEHASVLKSHTLSVPEKSEATKAAPEATEKSTAKDVPQ
ncbi:MAG: preprotein translocase subunit SecG [Methylophilaceae bacterium]|uniref:preprotein translocase subunit SecG n=1 Tax=Methylovorus sp. MM2 TaxID=1848038 RepID=UPI0007E15928|nr:preprotein translocase subunit SecG [Methylovorus sp. MM2]OAM51181.1 preprotein translocase subunit SecG [Methylovorus sp. MM2]